MKRITLLLIAIICIIGTVNAQKTQTLQVDALQQKKATIIPSDANTVEEQNLMKQPFYKTSDAVKGVNVLSIAYGINNTTKKFVRFDTGDGILTEIHHASNTIYLEDAGAVNPFNPTTAYVLDTAGSLYSVDVASGIYTPLGTIPGSWRGLEYDISTGLLFGIALVGTYPNTAMQLHTIDIAGLTSTLVSTTAISYSSGLAIDYYGDAYVWDNFDDNLYALDLTNGATTLIGPIGFDSNYGQGFFWDYITNMFYMTSTNSNTHVSELRSVNVATGATTVIGVLDGRMGWASSSFLPPLQTHACGDYTRNPNLPINDNSTNIDNMDTLISTALITDLDIVVNITHSWLADLEIRITSPAGTVVDLFINQCNNANSGMDITFDDEALGFINCLNTPTVGRSLPYSPLSAFDGEPFEGTWRISILDEFAQDTGVLNTWCLIPSLSGLYCPAPTSLGSAYATHESIQLGWSSDGQSMWDVEWGAVGFTPGTGTYIGMLDDYYDSAYVITDLTPSTNYEYYARAVCNSNENSSWTGPWAFSTLAAPIPCGDPTTGTVSNITHETADLGWTAGPDAESMWDVEWGAVGFVPDTATEIGMADDTSDNPLTISGLTASTDYEFYVKAVCNNNDNSGWAGPFAFTTLVTASIEELEAVGFNYYPNPVSNDLFLTARENITSVTIYNMLGQELKSVEPLSIETTISMSNLATGPYFVKAQIGSTVSAFKVIKK